MRSEEASATVVALVIVGLLMVLGAGLGTVAAADTARLRAQTAADAAALAAAPLTFRPFGSDVAPRTEAARVADSNGGRLVACRGCVVDPSWESRVVEVAVAMSVHLPFYGSKTVVAVAAAEFVPTLLLDLP